MTSVTFSSSASAAACSRISALACSVSSGSYRKQAGGHERRHEGIPGAGDQHAIRHRRQRGDQARQHPQAEQERHADVAGQVHLHPLQLFDAQRSRDHRGDREYADRRQGHDKSGRLRDGLSGRGQHVEEERLLRDVNERHADEDAEQHDRRHDVVGERIERIGRDVQIEEVERLALHEQRRAEERRALTDRKRQREEQDRGERDRPEREQDQPDPFPERPGMRRVERAESADDRHRHVRQDGHLQQLDVGVGDDLQRRRPFAGEQPQRDPARDADGDSRRRRGAPGGPCDRRFCARHGGVDLGRHAIPRHDRGHIVVSRRHPSPDPPANGTARPPTPARRGSSPSTPRRPCR
jgi:hypothetical protein